MAELYIAIGIVLGLIAGIAIGHKARKERDSQINELGNELKVKQNVIELQNDIIAKMRKKINKKANDADDNNN